LISPNGTILTLIIVVNLVLNGGYFLPLLSASAEEAISLPSGFESKSIITGLKNPTDIVFSDDGRWFITERTGKVRVVQNGQLLEAPLLDITSHVSCCFNDRGLLSIALDPDFEANGYIYLLYTYQRVGTDVKDPQTNRLTRIQLDPPAANILTPAVNPPEEVLLGAISTPYDQGQFDVCKAGTDCMPNDYGNHAADDILFAPDKTMYVSVGDGSAADFVDERSLRSQDKNWMAGKVLRIDRDGKGLETNPFWNGDPDAPISKVYDYGLRNPFRLATHPEFGLFIADVGAYNWEEINHSSPGANFGWPCFEGSFAHRGFARDAATKQTCDAVYTHSEIVTMPFFSYPHPKDGTAAVIGGTFYVGDLYPLEFKDNYFFADLIQGYIKRIVLDSFGNFVSLNDFASGLPPFITNVFSFPDGDIGWLSLYSGEVAKISFSAGNRMPVAIASSNVSFGSLPLSVQFTGDQSYDPDGDTLSYSWDFGDGSMISTEINPQHIFTVRGNYTTTLTIRDGDLASSSRVVIYAGNTPPDVLITSPAIDSSFIEDETIYYSATASDLQDGGIPENHVEWQLILRNEGNKTILQNLSGYQGSFKAPYEDNTAYYELQFSATDTQGLTANTSIIFNVLSASKYHYDPSLPLFDGNYLDIPETASLKLSEFSVASWFKTAKNDRSFDTIVNRDGGESEATEANQNYEIGVAFNQQIQAGFRSSDGTPNFVTSPGRYNDSRWHYAVVTYDDSVLALYLDGIQVSKLPTTAVPDTSGSKDVRIGAKSTALRDYFVGNVDEVRIWNRAITAAEVADQYNRGIFNADGQMVHVSFGSLPDTIPPDTAIIASIDSNGIYISNYASTSSSSISVTFAARDDFGIRKIEYRLDSSPSDPWVSVEGSPLTLNNIATGGHVLELRAEDIAGNVDPTPAVLNWGVGRDTGPSTVTLPYGVEVSFTNGNVTGFNLDSGSKSISLEIGGKSDNDGKLTITLPRSLIDARNATSDIGFVITAGENMLTYKETESSETERQLIIDIPVGTKEVEIVGTRVVPEFSSQFLLTAVAVGSVIIFASMNRFLRKD
jgi:glucose/arabinose dehydrogenase